MNADVKEKWLAALRSGEFKQGKERLKNGDTYCCLGVLTELYRREHGGVWTDEDDFATSTSGRGQSKALPPLSVQWWAELDDTNPIVLTPTGPEPVASLNDQGSTFSEIADLIEESL